MTRVQNFYVACQVEAAKSTHDAFRSSAPVAFKRGTTRGSLLLKGSGDRAAFIYTGACGYWCVRYAMRLTRYVQAAEHAGQQVSRVCIARSRLSSRDASGAGDSHCERLGAITRGKVLRAML